MNHLHFDNVALVFIEQLYIYHKDSMFTTFNDKDMQDIIKIKIIEPVYFNFEYYVFKLI